MYSAYPQFVFGFHGCDESVANDVISQKSILRISQNDYDWLGNGIYFWENNPQRALEFAKDMKKLKRPPGKPINKPAVIGAVIDLGYCLNLLNSGSLQIVKTGYEMFTETQMKAGYPLPTNKPAKGSKDLLLRHLDCAVIESIHAYNRTEQKNEYDSVRGVFFEGSDLYENAGFKEKNHIQICVRNSNCIKGLFHPRQLEDGYI